MGSGGVDRSAQRAQIEANKETLDLIERQTQRASRDVQKLFGSAEQNLLAGNQAALGTTQQYAPQQFGALQQGNLMSQQQLLAGMPQVQNALLGLPTDFSGMQARTFTPDLSFIQNAQIPQFQTSQQALAPTLQELVAQQQAQQPSTTDMMTMMQEIKDRESGALAKPGSFVVGDYGIKDQSIINAMNEYYARGATSSMNELINRHRVGGLQEGLMGMTGGRGASPDEGAGRRGTADKTGRSTSGGRANSAGGAAGRGPGGSV